MDPTTLAIAGAVILLALIFDFTNGFHDAANLVATVIASRALSPGVALAIASCAELAGALFLGTAVAQTMGSGIVDPTGVPGSTTGVLVVAAALVGAITWNLVTWYYGLPSSSSHALIGGLVGAFLVGWGAGPVHWALVGRIIAIMVAAPIVGFLATYAFTVLTVAASRWSSPAANRVFQRLEIASMIAQALSHGTNDAQKTMGVITFTLALLGLIATPVGASFVVPTWVIMACALALAAGTLSGGMRIVKTLGTGLYRVRPMHAFASQTASSAVIYLTAAFGFPISTTQVISSSVMGAGAAVRPRMVRWLVAREMALAWLVTIPASGLIAALVYGTLSLIRNLSTIL